MRPSHVLPLAATLASAGRNSTYTNPILPGWNSDPSCTFVPDHDNTFFCTTSSFPQFPGIPVYASKDLTNWRLASNALTRPEQLPELSNNGTQSEGIWASTLRYREGTFYIITSYVQFTDWGPKILLFTTTDPYDDDGWSDPLVIENPGVDIDLDLFWDDDGKVYMSVAAGIYVCEVDLSTGAASEPIKVWNGTGDRNPEGPHLFKRDGWYYLLIGEGGTEMNHTATMARSKSIEGPYEPHPHNPILTARGTPSLFQTVGHVDLFQDADDNWWAVALATRSGPDWKVFPMGRETVLVPVTWEAGEWPVLDPVAGRMSGPLPRRNRNVAGGGHWVDEPDRVDFKPGSQLPKHFGFWRPPNESLFAISPPGHPGTLRITPSRANLTADGEYERDTKEGLGFVFRRQSSTLFSFTVDLLFAPETEGEEAGVTVFLTQQQHIDMGIIKTSNGLVKLKFHVEASGKPDAVTPPTREVEIPKTWQGPLRLTVETTDASHYAFSASPVDKPHDRKLIGTATGDIVSGGSGPFTGSVVGVYATGNGGNGKTPAYFNRWRYYSIGQAVSNGEIVKV